MTRIGARVGALPARHLLMTPGPTNVSDEVRLAMMTPDLSHRDPAFRAILTEVTSMLPRLLGGRETHSCVLFAGSGTGAMEAILSSLTGELLVIVNGRYSQRIAEIAKRFGIATILYTVEESQYPDLDALTQTIESASPTHLALVHHETTTGTLLPLRAIGEIARQYGLQLIVDGVSSVGAHEIDLVRDHVSFLSLNPNKCLESFPGVGLVIASNDLLPGLEDRARSFYFDLHAQWRRLQRGEVPYTVPVQIVCALHTALLRLEQEGYDRRVERYAQTAAYAREILQRSGFEVIELPKSIRGNLITTMRLPSRVPFSWLHDCLQADHITIYSDAATIASGHFFIATMGAISEIDIDLATASLRHAVTAYAATTTANR